MEIPQLERDLVEKCIGRDTKAQYQLYHKYCKAMYNICFRMLNDHQISEDVLQVSFVDVFNRLESFNYQSSVGAWIKRVVINNCIDYLRRRKEHFREIDERTLEMKEEDVEELSINVKSIQNAVELLPDGYRTVFTLYAFEGYDHEEISQILKVSVETSKSQYHRAKNKLKEIIKVKGIKITDHG